MWEARNLYQYHGSFGCVVFGGAYASYRHQFRRIAANVDDTCPTKGAGTTLLDEAVYRANDLERLLFVLI